MDDKQKLIFAGGAVVVAIFALASKRGGSGTTVTQIGNNVDVVGLANAEVEGEKARLNATTSIATTLLQLEGVKSEHSRDTTIAGINANRDVTISQFETNRDVSVARTQSDRDVRLGEIHSASEQAGYRAQVDTANIQARAMERSATEARKSATTSSLINTGGSIVGGILGSVFGPVGSTAGASVGGKVANFFRSLF